MVKAAAKHLLSMSDVVSVLQGEAGPLGRHVTLDVAPVKLAACQLLPQPKLHQHLRRSTDNGQGCCKASAIDE